MASQCGASRSIPRRREEGCGRHRRRCLRASESADGLYVFRSGHALRRAAASCERRSHTHRHRVERIRSCRPTHNPACATFSSVTLTPASTRIATLMTRGDHSRVGSLAETAGRNLGSRVSRPARRRPPPRAAMLFLPAVNQMIDITRTRLMATRMHPPPIVYAMLAVVALVGALLAGYHMAGGKARSWLHTIGFAVVSRRRCTSFSTSSTHASA